MKIQKGITLIALVITIIVLLILAGVSISLIVGNNGILSNATKASDETKEVSAREDVAFAWTSVDSEFLMEWSEDMTKSRSDFFTESKLNGYLEDKGTISNLFYNPNGTSFLTYTINKDRKSYQIQIDQYGNTSSALADLFARKITPKNYGDKIEYTAPNGYNEWLIFYTDGENVFIIAKDAVDHTYIKTDELGMIKHTDESGRTYGISWDAENFKYNGAEDINLAIANKYKLGWVKENSTSQNDNAKVVASLLDITKWDGFVDTAKADSAIGSPTIEMFFDSWNQKGYNKAYCNNYNENGYYLGIENKPTTYEILMWKLQDNLIDRLYRTSTGRSAGYWLASPDAENEKEVINQYNDNGSVNGDLYNDRTYYGLRPVVCLKSSVNLVQEEGIWKFE